MPKSLPEDTDQNRALKMRCYNFFLKSLLKDASLPVILDFYHG